MLRQIRGQNAAVYFQNNPIPHRLRQVILKDGSGAGKQSPCLRGAFRKKPPYA